MRCASCGADLISGKAFCPSCGAAATMQCPGCGAVVQPGFRFCPDCGAGLAADGNGDGPAPGGPADDRLARLSRHIPDALASRIVESRSVVAGERKLVTVLFCDLVGSTALAERLDPEEYRDLLDEYLAMVFREIYRFDGIVNQLAGDGLMALFGAPVAHEDAPRRAVLAALEIQGALGEAGRAARGGTVLAARIGIHTGPVVVGTVGNDLKMDYTAIGDTTNLAARLEAAANPGTILVSDATYRLVRGFFTVRAVGPLDLKGKSDPVTAYEVHAPLSSATPMGVAVDRGLTPLVGRTEELAQLRGCLDRLTGHLAQVVAIVGDAGSGKSRLLYEFRERLRGESVVFLEGRCSSLSQMIPYGPFAMMLRGYFGAAPDETGEPLCARVADRLRTVDPSLVNAYPFLCQLLSLPVDAIPEGVSAADRKRETFDAVARLVLGLAARGPVVMVVEDVQWIDELSRELLETAASRLERARMMLVVTHRADFELSLRTSAAFTRLTLRRLSDADTLAIVAALVGGPLPTPLERRILAKADGNPFITEELTRTLLEDGDVVCTDGRVRLTRAIDDIPIPNTIHEIIGARLDRLDPSAKRVVQVAAVFGRQFRRDELARILPSDGVSLDTTLDDLERRGLIHQKAVLSRDEFRFGESLTQEVAYEGLLLKERRHLHGRIARMLESLPGGAGAERSSLLAHHFARSDEPARAVPALLIAAREAEELPSYATAVGLFRQAWELAEAALARATNGPGPARTWALQATAGLSRLSIIYGAMPSTDVLRITRRGRELAAELGDDEANAYLGSLEGMQLLSVSRSSYAEGLRTIEEALAIADRGGRAGSRVAISRALALAYLVDGRFDAARERIDWIMTNLEESGAAARLADVYFGACWVRDAFRLFSDDLAGAEAGAAEAYEQAVRAKNRTGQTGFAAKLAHAKLLQAQYAEAAEWADRCLALSAEIDNLAAMVTASAVAIVARNALREPTARYVGSLEDALGAGNHLLLNAPLVVEALLVSGEIARAERFAENAYAHAGGRLREALSACALGDVMARIGTGRRDAALQWYDTGAALAERIGAGSPLVLARIGRAEIAYAREGRSDGTVVAEILALCRTLRLGHYAERASRLPTDTATSAGLRAV
jgi:class 3 adenylate cyclase/tetratricopeptide (TPR) repeat protein